MWQHQHNTDKNGTAGTDKSGTAGTMSHGTERLTNGGTQTDEKMYDATMVRGYLVMVPDLLMAVAGMMIDAVLMNILNVLVNTVTMPVDILDMILDETLRERRIAASVLLGSTVTDNGLDVRGLMKNNAFMMEVRGGFVKVNGKHVLINGHAGSLCQLGGGLCRLRRLHRAVLRRIGLSS